MAVIETLVGLARAQQRHLAQVGTRSAHAATALWDRHGGLSDASLDAYRSAVIPPQEAIRGATAHLTAGYLAAYTSAAGEPIDHFTPDIDAATVQRGVALDELWARPTVAARTAISNGASFADAMRAGRNRAEQIASTDVQLTARGVARGALSADRRIVAYRRVPSGKCCVFCATAATQRYHSDDLLPCHNHCHCAIAPIIGRHDPGHIIEPQALARLKELDARPYWTASGEVDWEKLRRGSKDAFTIEGRGEPIKRFAAPPKTTVPTPAPAAGSRSIGRGLLTGKKAALDRFGPALDDLGKIHGLPVDANDGVTELITRKNIGGLKGGHYSPATKRKRPPHKRGESRADYSARMDAWRAEPLHQEIAIIDRGDGTEELSFLHEFGHKIDNRGGSNFATSSASINAGHQRGLDDTETAIWEFLSAARETGTIQNIGKHVGGDYQFVGYFRDPREVWARAYSQWAAERLGGPYLKALRAQQAKSAYYQWTDDEFAVLSPLVERVLRARGALA